MRPKPGTNHQQKRLKNMSKATFSTAVEDSFMGKTFCEWFTPKQRQEISILRQASKKRKNKANKDQTKNILYKILEAKRDAREREYQEVSSLSPKQKKLKINCEIKFDKKNLSEFVRSPNNFKSIPRLENLIFAASPTMKERAFSPKIRKSPFSTDNFNAGVNKQRLNRIMNRLKIH